MSLQIKKFDKIFEELREKKEFNSFVENLVREVVVAGASTFIGGLLFGPKGLAIGGTMGSVGASVFCSQFKSVCAVSTKEEIKHFCEKVLDALRGIKLLDVITFIVIVLSSEFSKKIVGMSLKLLKQLK